MKKLFLSVFVLAGIALIAIYIFIPANIKLVNTVFIKTKPAVVNRLLMDETKWTKWLSPDSIYSEHSFRFKNYDYDFLNSVMNSATVLISGNQKPINSLISVIPVNEDSIAVEWKAATDAGVNPITRIKSYNEAKNLKKDMGDILDKLHIFLNKKQNAYGLNITEQRVVDTILISTKLFSNNFPTTGEIYSLINKLQNYIFSQGAKETNPPMLNIIKDEGSYRAMVAIPVNRVLRETNNYSFKRMIPGRILVAEVTGGDYTAMQAINQLDLYISDNHMSSPAIPFQSLITDRSNQPDTTKWITKIYYPVY
ncbi:MAG: GyrI-like domain-containing protein [Ginsengibacter sp.]